MQGAVAATPFLWEGRCLPSVDENNSWILLLPSDPSRLQISM